MNEKIIKSADRVKDHGEVFTPNRIVDLMLDQPEIMEKINDLHATFLEPSAGEGAFLVELLKRKLKVAMSQSKSARAFNTNSLIALSTLYGIEFLEDNVEMLVMNMILTFNQEYEKIIQSKYNSKANKYVEDSAKIIIQANMQQGDTLKQITASGNPIIFSEWNDIGGNPRKVQRTEYTFEAIVNQDGPTGSVKNSYEQLDLFASNADAEIKEPEKVNYVPCKWTDIYLREIKVE